MAASLGYTVVSFEPMSRNARKLARSLQRNAFAAHVTLNQNALGAVANQRVVLRETDPANQGNGQVTAQSLGTGSTYGVDYADTTTLSSAMLLIPMRPAGARIVKIDVEGMEAAVLAGARDWLCSQAVPYVLIEFSDATRASTAAPATEMFAFMRRAGYTVSDVNVQSDTPLDYDRLVAGDFAGVPPNLLFALSDTKRDPAGCPPY
jgi:FkbM family methyltransferase